MELDIQLTQDRVPILHHDTDFTRLCDDQRMLADVSSGELHQLSAHYPDKFGSKFIHNRLCTFDEFCAWLSLHNDVEVFIELKQEAIDYWSESELLDSIHNIITGYGVVDQCIIISFNHSILSHARQHYCLPIGWVLPSWNEQQQAIADQLEPEFLFSNISRLPPLDEQLWQGRWQWAVYNIDDVDAFLAMSQRNIGYIETNQIRRLIQADATVESC